jgi:predicted glycoside hydrolase/deacetylase ChbG (UPF0249 family)
LIFRNDDGGIGHSANRRLEQLIEIESSVSVSVMTSTSKYEKALELPRRHPATPVGVHLTLNSER